MVAHHRRFTPRRGGVGGRHVRNRDAAGGRPRLPDPHGLAAFYRELVGGEITHADDEWVSLRDGGDLAAAEAKVLALGARRHEVQPPDEAQWRVYLDPAGHPFCLCWD
jgi:Glyoxalase-like domain